MTLLARGQWSWRYTQWNPSAIDRLVCSRCRDYCNTTQGIILQGMWTLRWIYRSCRIKCERGFGRLYQVLLVTFPEALVTRSIRDKVPASEGVKPSGIVKFLSNETWPLEGNAVYETQLSLSKLQASFTYSNITEIYLSLRGTRWQGSAKDYITRNLMICTPHQMLFVWSNQEEWDGRGMWHVWRTGEEHKVFRWEGMREGDHLEDFGVDGKIKLKWVVNKWDREAGTGLLWLRTGAGVGRLWMR
jgi:hypothetical protein